jgi:uncharacterized membrane protein (DUF373 family)
VSDEPERIMGTPARRKHFAEFKANWLTLGVYERFEQVVALIITWLIAAVVIIAVWRLSREVLSLFMAGLLNPLDHKVFQAVFGETATVLIALEFRHSITRVAPGRAHIIEVQTVLLIAILALARKFIILDVKEYDATQIFALAAVVIAVGVTYWLVRERGARAAAA